MCVFSSFSFFFSSLFFFFFFSFFLFSFPLCLPGFWVLIRFRRGEISGSRSREEGFAAGSGGLKDTFYLVLLFFLITCMRWSGSGSGRLGMGGDGGDGDRRTLQYRTES